MLYTLHLNFKDRIMEYTLPSYDNGIHKVDISHETGSGECVLVFEAIDGLWRILKNRYISISGCQEDGVPLRDGGILNVNVCNTDISFVILAIAIGNDMYGFEKYLCSDSMTIGSSPNSDIYINDELVSHRHAVIEKKDTGFVINDFSTNGIYINNKKASSQTKLNVFDSIYIFGAKIIFLGKIIAVSNHRNTSVKLDSVDSKYADCPEIIEKTQIFSKSAYSEKQGDRFLKDNFPVVLKTPVSLEYTYTHDIQAADIIKTSFPSSALLTLALSYVNSLSTTQVAIVFSSVAVALSGVTFFSSKIQNIMLERKTKTETSRLKETLMSENLRLLECKTGEYRDMMNTKYKKSSQIIKESNGSIVYKKINNKDFLKIRVATGKSDITEYIRYEGDLKNDFPEKYRILDDMPFVIDLSEKKVIGVTGTKEQLYRAAASMAIQIASSFSCDDVRIMSFYNSSESENIGFMKWFPHSFSDNRVQRYTACTEKSYKNLLFTLTEELSERTSLLTQGNDAKFFPHYIVFSFDSKIFENETIQKYIRSREKTGVTFILLYGETVKLPDECDAIISHEENTITYTGSVLQVHEVTADSTELADADLFARRLIASYDEENRINIPIADSMTYFDMLSVRAVEEIDIIRNYKLNRVDDGISACIGVGANDKRFYLDMHEKKHGPHGLVAGTTGSGKSEALQTLITSLAMNYHPDELAFVLIDYKGGGMSDAFEELPHIAGVVTNLTGSASDSDNQIRRILISLGSEIRKRQKLLSTYKINHIDTYIKLYRAGKADEVCPHLVIIVDEFAELKKERPDFINRLISTARIGRSLGLHLILATQKPTGVVDDEIWGNSRFRLCLKVQDKADSMGMLKRPEASSITTAGRAYIQVGNDEIFDLIQTGYTGAVYNPEESRLSRLQRAYMIDIDASESVLKSGALKEENLSTQLDTAVRYIQDICMKNNVPQAQKLWCASLPEFISYDKLEEYNYDRNDTFSFCFGLTDDPENQDIYPSVMSLERSNIIISGNTGSGKTVLLETILFDLCKNYGPDRFLMYILDFTGGLFEVFRELPQCIDVFQMISDVQIRKFFDSLKSELDRRKLLFANSKVTSFSEYRTTGAIPALTVAFEGYHIFREMYPEFEEDFMKISRECVKYGIYFIVTVKQISDIKFRTRQNFTMIIPLRLNDRAEYSEIFGMRPDFNISDVPGRGIVCLRNRLLEFQTLICSDSPCTNKMSYLSKQIEKIKEEFSDLESKLYLKSENIPYCYDMGEIPDEKFYNAFDKTFLQEKSVFVWLDKNGADGVLSHDDITLYHGVDGAYEMLLKLKKEFSKRNESRKKYNTCDDKGIFVFIDSMEDFLRCIYDEKYKEDMSAITEIFWQQGSGLGINFISRIKKISIYEKTKSMIIFKSYGAGRENA